MKGAPNPARLPPLTLLVTTLALAIFMLPGAAEQLQLQKAALYRGEIWRLITCHLTHWNTSHLLWDAVMFALLGFVCERRDGRAYRRCLLTAAILIPLGLLILEPRLATYRGLSGIDAALFVLLARQLARGPQPWRRRLAMLALLGFLAKIAYEAITATPPFVTTTDSFTPAATAHLLGALAAVTIPLTPKSNPTNERPHSNPAAA